MISNRVRTTFLSKLMAMAILVVPVSFATLHADQPNIVVIMSDDMGYSDIGCFGGEIRTPNLDALANDGLRFTNFYSENMCWVSRAALLTGVYHKSSMYKNSVHPRCVTLAEALKQNGYATKMSGKWHLAGKPYRIFPVDRGFDEYYGILGGAASFYAPAFLTRNRKNVDAEAINDPEYYITDAISHEAVRMIHEADDEDPLFLSVAYTTAHWPLHAKADDIEAYKGKYEMGWDELRTQRLTRMKQLGIVPKSTGLSPRNVNVSSWTNTPDKDWHQRRMEVYAAQITSMDAGIGKIIKALKETNRFENTLIFFTIDNGGCHVEYGPERTGDYLPKTTRDGRPMRPGNLPNIMPGPEDTYQSYGYGWANASNTPYRMFKKYNHEGGIRTPMIAHWPKGIDREKIASKNGIISTVSHLIDIMPTVLDISQTPVPERTVYSKAINSTPIKMDGHSLAPIFKGETANEHENLFFAHSEGKALRRGDWKIVALKNKKSKTTPWELYNLKRDPLELNDLAKEEPAKLKELKKIWESESKRLAQQAAIE